MYELFAARGAGSTVVEAALRLCGAPYEAVMVSLPWTDEPEAERLRAINPLRQAPTLILPGSEVMTESAAMILHLADRYPQAGLVPSPNDPRRPRFLRWLMFVVVNIYGSFVVSDDPSRFLADPAGHDALRAGADEWRKRLWRIVEHEAPASGWFLDDDLSAIDLYVAVMTRWRPRRPWFEAECPKLVRIADAVAADPRLAEVFARNFG